MSQVCVITGGTSGIGRCTAQAMLARGYTVYELSRRAEGVAGMQHIVADVTKEETLAAAVAQILQREDHIDVLINCASYGAGYGTENDNWYKATSELEPEAMVAELRAQGMAGIYLDLDGYTEEEQQPTLQALINAAGCDESDVIISEGGTLCYIPLGKG